MKEVNLGFFGLLALVLFTAKFPLREFEWSPMSGFALSIWRYNSLFSSSVWFDLSYLYMSIFIVLALSLKIPHNFTFASFITIIF